MPRSTGLQTRSPTASRPDEGMSLSVFGFREMPLPSLVLKQEIDMQMKNALTVVAAVAAAMFAQASFAQASSPSRADVKAETKAAEKSGQLTPAGEGSAPVAKSTAKSTTPRSTVKAETKAAEKAGQLTPAGEGAAPVDKSPMKSTKTRAERKAETRAAAKGKQLTPAGEGPDTPK
jgi:Domain of unknown function (DUF4148)